MNRPSDSWYATTKQLHYLDNLGADLDQVNAYRATRGRPPLTTLGHLARGEASDIIVHLTCSSAGTAT
jgi:hypothetical protein